MLVIVCLFLISVLLTSLQICSLTLSVLDIGPQFLSCCSLPFFLNLSFSFIVSFFFHDIWVVSLKYIKRYYRIFFKCSGVILLPFLVDRLFGMAFHLGL